MTHCRNCGRFAETALCDDCDRAYQLGWEDGWNAANGKDELRFEPDVRAKAIGYDGTLGPRWPITHDRPASTDVAALVARMDRAQRWREEDDDE